MIDWTGTFIAIFLVILIIRIEARHNELMRLLSDLGTMVGDALDASEDKNDT